MRRKLIALLVLVAMSFPLLGAGIVQAQGQDLGEALSSIINKLDISAAALRRNDIQPAKVSIRSAFDQYNNLFSPEVSKIDESLDGRVKNSFSELAQQPIEENIFQLRSFVLKAAGLIGVHLSPIYNYSLFIILAIGVLVGFFVTYVTKRMVNWEVIRQNKEKISAFQKEYREAMKKRDMKTVHKLKERQREVMMLQNQAFLQNLKPSAIIFVPLIVLWWLVFPNLFGGWVVAWMPFIRIDLPFWGPLVTFGYGWWYFLTYMGFYQIFRKIMIRD